MASNANPFSGFLGGSDWSSLLMEAMPRAAYYSSPTGQAFGAGSPRQQRYFQQGFQDVENQWYGSFGQQVRAAGEAGVAQKDFSAPGFAEWMEQQDPWTSRYTSLPQQARGVNTGLYNPRTRFLYY
jgi:hypothetical protein